MEKIECTSIPWIAMSISERIGLANARLVSFLCNEVLLRYLLSSFITGWLRNLAAELSLIVATSVSQLQISLRYPSLLQHDQIHINGPP